VENGVSVKARSVMVDITERKTAEQELKSAYNELEIERTLLQNKNVALRELMDQIDEHKQEVSVQLQSNVDKIILPLLRTIVEKLPPNDKHIVKLLEGALTDLTNPFGHSMERLASNLSPREVEVCNMVRNGFSSKQIASTLNVSVQTVNNQRYSIRRKLRIGDQTNLSSYLKSL
jgi:DNA-binding NarL/FixJ family response regulator